MDTLSEGLQEQSRLKITNKLRRFIEVDSNEAVKIGDLGKRSSSTRRFSRTRPSGKGAAELTLREGEESTLHSFINTANVGASRWGPLLVDADWHAFCRAICQGIEGQEWETMYYCDLWGRKN